MAKLEITSEVQWHELRRNNIGSSDAASLFGCNDFQSAYALWHMKRGLVALPDEDNARSSWGKRFEAPIAYGLAEDNGWVIEKAGYYQHPIVKGMGCTPDYIIIEGLVIDQQGNAINAAKDPVILEIKNLEQWGYFADFTDEEANHYIEIQIQHQFSCTGFKHAVLGYKLPGLTPLKQFKKRDNEFVALLEKRVTEFWASKKPPAPDGSDSSVEIVRALYDSQRGKTTIDMTSSNLLPHLIDMLEECGQSKAPLNKEIRDIEEKEHEYKNIIMSFSRGAEIVKFQGGEIKINTVHREQIAPCRYQTVTYKLNRSKHYE